MALSCDLCFPKSCVRVRRDNSLVEITRIIFFSFVSGRLIAAFWPRAAPKEAGCIACDGNEEDECPALARHSRRLASDGLGKAACGWKWFEGDAGTISGGGLTRLIK